MKGDASNDPKVVMDAITPEDFYYSQINKVSVKWILFLLLLTTCAVLNGCVFCPCRPYKCLALVMKLLR